MDAPNQFTRAAGVAGQTVRRLQREGLTAEEAKRLVSTVINEEELCIIEREDGLLMRKGSSNDCGNCRIRVRHEQSFPGEK
jgi:hypothetical protein